MASLNINLDSLIGELQDRWVELGDLAIDPGGGSVIERDDRRAKILKWRTRIKKLQSALDEIKINRETALVSVKGLTDDEISGFKKALNTVNKQIQIDQIWDNVVTLVTEILRAANTVQGTAGK
jgi:transcription initiation factor IIF auxiliary subunit